MKVQFENENKRPFKNQLYRKVHKDNQNWEMVDLKNENPIRKFKWKFNLKMEIKFLLKIGKNAEIVK